MNATKSAAAQRGIHGGRHLDGLARRLRQWRARRGSKGPLPQWVWDEASGAARDHGVSRVARVLGLDYDKLKRRAVVLPAAAGVSGAPPGFVELNLSPTPSISSEWTLELSDPQGRKLTLRGPSEPSSWRDLARAFWPQRA
ncbi:MAG: hypothetical protein H7A47_16530 [Verrucomicrobiales bacterium]|nr:hypothetical protein [Verrucomicrobiales bacterium]MCP5528396.1 hypothetical protein [Verrucomicrobiales bacterium]